MESIPDPFKHLKEYPSTYVVQDRSNEEEIIRLDEQDRLYTACMGGVLPEQPDPSGIQRVLDVGCGTGWWLTETARAYPEIAQLVGLDISGRMIEYARAQAQAAQVSDRVHFQLGDALRKLDFPSNVFDLVNQRFATSFLRKWDWPKLLHEYQRVCKPGGVIRITEMLFKSETNSPAVDRLCDLVIEAFWRAGHYFTPEKDGVTAHIPALMQQAGIEQVQTKMHTLMLHTDPQKKDAAIKDAQRAFRTFIPFLRKWIKFPPDYENIYQQMVRETQSSDFQSTGTTVITFWGKAG